MAFLLIYLDQKPMRLKGKSQLGGIAVADAQGELPIGAYCGIKSGKAVNVYASGGHVVPSPEAATAFSCSQPIPVTLDEGLRDIVDPMNEVYIPEGSKAILQEFRIHSNSLQNEVKGHWIPANFFGDGALVGSGWVKQSDVFIDVMVLCNKHEGEQEISRVVPIFAPKAAFDIR